MPHVRRRYSVTVRNLETPSTRPATPEERRKAREELRSRMEARGVRIGTREPPGVSQAILDALEEP